MTTHKKSSVPALERAIRIMEALAEGGETTSMGLARRLNISQSSCYRICQTLEEADWIRPDADNGYVFSFGLRPFVAPLLGVERVSSTALPVMKSITDKTGLAIKLSTRQGMEQITIARVEAPRPFSISSPVGTRFPTVQGSSGAALLSTLDDAQIAKIIATANQLEDWGEYSENDLHEKIRQCRQHGVCENISMDTQAVQALAAPLRALQESFSITLVGLSRDFDLSRVDEYKELLRHATETIRARLGETD